MNGLTPTKSWVRGDAASARCVKWGGEDGGDGDVVNFRRLPPQLAQLRPLVQRRERRKEHQEDQRDVWSFIVQTHSLRLTHNPRDQTTTL